MHRNPGQPTPPALSSVQTKSAIQCFVVTSAVRHFGVLCVPAQARGSAGNGARWFGVTNGSNGLLTAEPGCDASVRVT